MKLFFIKVGYFFLSCYLFFHEYLELFFIKVGYFFLSWYLFFHEYLHLLFFKIGYFFLSNYLLWPFFLFRHSGGFTVLFSLLVVIVPIFLLIALSTLIERKVMASIQRRIGPNVVGFWGLLQPIADGIKLIFKERHFPKRIYIGIFLLAPVLLLTLSLYVWFFCALPSHALIDVNLTLLFLIAIGILETYGIVFAGWASNSKYALLGGLRSTAQMISYEIAVSFIFLAIILITGSFNLTEIVYYQTIFGWFLLPLLPYAGLFLIAMLAETNRTPFDLPEAEAELVAGYNVEYSSLLFALFFLGEYASMLFLSTLFTLLFLGGWSYNINLVALNHADFLVFCLLDTTNFLFLSLKALIFGIKSLCILFLFVWVRATLPRYRYDQLMDLGWKIFLPFAFGFFLFLLNCFYLTSSLPEFENNFINIVHYLTKSNV